MLGSRLGLVKLYHGLQLVLRQDHEELLTLNIIFSVLIQ